MAPRQTFSKKSKPRSDAFAAMLHSSPDIKVVEDKPTVIATKKQPIGGVTELRRSPRRKKADALQEIDHNAVPRKIASIAAPAIALKQNTSTADAADQVQPTKKPRSSRARPKSCEVIAAGRGKTKNIQVQAPFNPTQLLRRADSTTSSAVCHYHQHCVPLLNLQEGMIQAFDDWEEQLAEHLDLNKIAEASYGEVYRLAVKDSVDASDLSVAKCGQSVLKMIALKPPTKCLPTSKRERDQRLKKTAFMSTPQDVGTEVRLLQRMSSIPGFINFRDVRILKGRPGPLFSKAYTEYNKAQKRARKEKSIFPDPAHKYAYTDDQLWAVIEMQDAGTDLERLMERLECRSIFHIWDIFWQVVLSLAKGEESAEFEHRDLHLGNICVRGDTNSRTESIDMSRKLGYTDIDVTLIDYTISRASMPEKLDESVAYLDLSKDEYIFNGDSSSEYQYEIYRYMRSAFFFDDAKAKFGADDSTSYQKTGRSWKQFQPQTNLIWLHFILHLQLNFWTLTDGVDKWPKNTTKAMRERMVVLKEVLDEVRDLVQPDVVIKNGLRSASELVAMAVEREWLDIEDVTGSEQSLLDATLERSFAALSIVR